LQIDSESRHGAKISKRISQLQVLQSEERTVFHEEAVWIRFTVLNGFTQSRNIRVGIVRRPRVHQIDTSVTIKERWEMGIDLIVIVDVITL
jgi:hypothetical protein